MLLSLLWMPALLPVASRLQLLPRALLSMASGSSPSQSSPASGSSYIPGSVSAAFVTCPNETVAKEIARWGPQCEERMIMNEGWGWGRKVPSRGFLPASGLETCLWVGSAKVQVMGCSEWGCLFTFRAVVEKRLAACVNVIPQITSM